MFGRKKVAKKRTVLFVDDDEVTLHSLERGLLDESYNKLFAKSSKEAHEIVRREDVHVIVTNMRMPEMTGLELLRIVRKEYPYIIGVVLSGYTDQAPVLQTIDQVDIVKFLPKPWNHKENFKKYILEALDCYNLQSECNTVRLW